MAGYLRVLGDNMSDDNTNLLQLTTGVVASYVGSHSVPAEDLPDLMRSVYRALGALEAPSEAPRLTEAATPQQIRRSITPDALISFEDNKSYKQLRRHLTSLGMSPADYRAKWGLPADYPMVAASSSATRSAIAKAAGFGRKRQAPPAAMPAPTAQTAKSKVKGKLSLFGRREPK
jgi:predicted transcriptional regulator